jgi:hypothetical protein
MNMIFEYDMMIFFTINLDLIVKLILQFLYTFLCIYVLKSRNLILSIEKIIYII